MPPKDKPIKPGPHAQYVEGLKGIMEKLNLSLDEARDLALKDATEKGDLGDEHIPSILEAWKKLKEQE